MPPHFYYFSYKAKSFVTHTVSAYLYITYAKICLLTYKISESNFELCGKFLMNIGGLFSV